MAGKRDYYEVLEVSREADEATITQAYRRLAKKYHPDRNGGDKEAEARFRECAEAFEVLRDPERRARYDHYGHAGLDGVPMPHFDSAEDVMDVFGELFGFFGGGRRRGRAAGRDLETAIEIDLHEAYTGVVKTIRVRREEACHDCSGSGAKPGTRPATCRRCGGRGVVVQGMGLFQIQQTCPGCGGRGSVITDPCLKCRGAGRVPVEQAIDVTIPPGMEHGKGVCLQGYGEAGRGGPPGDLNVYVRVRKHRLFVRDGLDLHCEMPITFSRAALGGAIEVPTLEGKFVTHYLKRGVQSGDTARVADLGMPRLRPDGTNDGRRGDLVVHLKVITPTKLSKRQEELLRELDELDAKDEPPERKSFFERVKAFFNPGADEAAPKT
jgi:molecular chaperone DnaJ